MNRRGPRDEELAVEIEPADHADAGHSGGTRAANVTNKNRKNKGRRAA